VQLGFGGIMAGIEFDRQIFAPAQKRNVNQRRKQSG
jgi:hypothetical protein